MEKLLHKSKAHEYNYSIVIVIIYALRCLLATPGPRVGRILPRSSSLPASCSSLMKAENGKLIPHYSVKLCSLGIKEPLQMAMFADICLQCSQIWFASSSPFCGDQTFPRLTSFKKNHAYHNGLLNLQILKKFDQWSICEETFLFREESKGYPGKAGLTRADFWNLFIR